MTLRTSRTLTRRVVSSVVALAMRTTWERLLTLASMVFVARILGPRDIGVAAVTLAVTAVAGTLVDGGMSTALVRQPEDVTAAQLKTARRVMVRACVFIATLTAAACLVNPRYGPLLLLSAAKIPLRPVTLATRVGLARGLEFGGIAFGDGLGLLAQAATAVVVAATVAGPVALVGADLAGSLVANLYVVLRLRSLVPPPVDDSKGVTGVAMLRQGLPYQGFATVVALRDLVTSAFVSVVVGVQDLGLLQFAARSLSPVMIVFQAVGQVAIPLGANIPWHSRTHQVKLEKGFLVAGMCTAVVLATAAAPAKWLVPLVFGQRWSAAAAIVAAIALALVISGPLNSFGVGLIVAAGRPAVASSAVAACAAWFMASMLVLTPVLGGVAAGAWSWVGLACVEATIVVVACRRIVGVRLAVPTCVPVGVFALAYATGTAAAYTVTGDVARSAVATVVALATAGAGALVVAARPALSLFADARRGSGVPEMVGAAS